MAYHIVMPRPLEADLQRDAAQPSELRPRHSIAMLAQELGATLHAPAGESSNWADRMRSRVLPDSQQWALARRLSQSLKAGDVVFCTSEHPGFHVAALAAGRRRARAVVFVHNVDRPRARAAIQLWRLNRRVERFVACSSPQASFLRQGAGVPDDHVAQVWDHTDTEFFKPGPASAGKLRPRIVSVGLEGRDYRTLAQATRDMDVDVRISGFSRDSAVYERTFPPTLPENMTRRFYGWPELAQLYRDADVVVVSVFESRYAAGVQALMEGMASGRPVVVTRSRGLEGYIDERACIPVPPGEPKRMADAIRHLLDHPAEAAAMGRRGRELALERHTMEAYVARLRTLVTRSEVAA